MHSYVHKRKTLRYTLHTFTALRNTSSIAHQNNALIKLSTFLLIVTRQPELQHLQNTTHHMLHLNHPPPKDHKAHHIEPHLRIPEDQDADVRPPPIPAPRTSPATHCVIRYGS
ncbi:unnamed protein product [Colias eurytheme]|nr:unnamed protein product [Colias eurytheme]